MEQQLTTKLAERFTLRPYKAWQLCAMYGIDRKTFLKWTKQFEQELGKRHGHYYTISQVRTIIENLGIPGKMIAEID